ncbi:MAG: hypothetical protein ACOCWJ_06670, partial [Verrucomicrobiota bacterium]
TEERSVPYAEALPNLLKGARPERTDFDAFMMHSHYEKRLFAVIDRGIAGASKGAKKATEARLIVTRDDLAGRPIAEVKEPFHGAFALFLVDLPDLTVGEIYKASVLLFDTDMRIVGEKELGEFTYRGGPWKNNKLGLDDVVWEGMGEIEADERGFSTLKHRFDISRQGLPKQIAIKPDPRELPLEKRAADAELSAAELIEMGRGPQLRDDMRLEAVIDGERIPAKIVQPAKRVRTWKSEVEYETVLAFGEMQVKLITQYDCDGSVHCELQYGSEVPLVVDKFELIMPVDGQVDIAFAESGRGSMGAADTRDCSLPEKEGVVWDSSQTKRALAYGRFVPWFWFGSGDRGFTWYCDSSQGWLMNAEGSTLQLERDNAGDVTMRVQFVNHSADVKGSRTIPFSLLTHPAKNKPESFRAAGWHYTLGHSWSKGYFSEAYDLPESYLKKHWREAAQAPADLPYEKADTWRKDDPPFMRYGKWRNVQAGFKEESPRVDRMWEDKATYLFERQIRVGRRVGWHMDEYWPIAFGYSDNVATGDGHLVPSEQVTDETLPWAPGYLTRYQRGHYKRLARIHKTNNVPLRHQSWSNNEATMLESFWYSSFLVEGAGAAHRAYDVDVVTQFPSPLYRYFSQSFSGLATAHMADHTYAEYGDDKVLDRQIVGRALLHDIGVTPRGAHGIIYHKEDVVRLLAELTDFGFFNDRKIEKLPYWRNDAYVKMGDKPSRESKVYVTVYRRPLEDAEGYKALFVVMNERLEPVSLPLELLDIDRILGGPNTLTAGAVRRKTEIPEELQDWWRSTTDLNDNTIVLRDIESGEAVPVQKQNAQSYGPIHIPFHNYRVFSAEHRKEN